jgi:hypothetical protein
MEMVSTWSDTFGLRRAGVCACATQDDSGATDGARMHRFSLTCTVHPEQLTRSTPAMTEWKTTAVFLHPSRVMWFTLELTCAKEE